MQLLARRLTPQPRIRYFVHQKLVELNIAIPVVVKVLEDGLHVGHVHNVVVVLVLGYLQDEPEYKVNIRKQLLSIPVQFHKGDCPTSVMIHRIK